MRVIEQKPAACGFFGTIAVWALILLFFYLTSALFSPKQFKTIKIRLDAPSKNESPAKKQETAPQPRQASESAASESTPAAQNAPSADVAPVQAAQESAPPPSSAPKAEPVQQSVAKASPAPAPAPKKESAKPKSDSKPASKRTESKSSSAKNSDPKPAATPTKKSAEKVVEQPKPVEQTLQKSMEELMAEQQQKKAPPKKSADEMWAELEAKEGNTSQTPNNPTTNQNILNDESPFSKETVADASGIEGNPVTSQSDKPRKDGGRVSDETRLGLKRALGAKKYKGDLTSKYDSLSGNSEDGIQTSDGRKLIKPNPPSLRISSDVANSAGKYTINFIVRPDGHIDTNSITIIPSGILPTSVLNELKAQLSQEWLFSSSTSNTFGKAQLPYEIKEQ